MPIVQHTADPAMLVVALLLGLGSTLHCLVMCGPLAAAIPMAASSGRRWPRILAYNGGRIASYVLGGTLAASLGGALLLAGGGPVRMLLSLLAATAVVLTVAGQAGWIAAPRLLEHWGRRAWLKVAPLGRLASRRGDLAGVLLLGLLWGWLPCGMVYAALALAAATLDPLRGASVMLAFGLGTLPSMIGAGWLVAGLRGGLPRPRLQPVRHLLAAGVIGLTVWTTATALQPHAGHSPGNPNPGVTVPHCVSP